MKMPMSYLKKFIVYNQMLIIFIRDFEEGCLRTDLHGIRGLPTEFGVVTLDSV